ncbi:MAG: ATP-binding protein [Pirellulales bacterium]|nr:ATP-binding protein [Pirellulales bacterium]
MFSLRPWQIWLAGAALLFMVVSALSWLSVRAIQADQAEQNAQAQAIQEENIRLALWRIDTQMAALINDESSRPIYNYQSVFVLNTPTVTNYDTQSNESVTNSVACVSPLIVPHAPEITTYFQCEPSGKLTCPSVPEPELRKFLIPQQLTVEDFDAAEVQLAKLRPLLDYQLLLKNLPNPELTGSSWQVQSIPVQPFVISQQNAVQNTDYNATLSNPPPAGQSAIPNGPLLPEPTTWNIAAGNPAAGGGVAGNGVAGNGGAGGGNPGALTEEYAGNPPGQSPSNSPVTSDSVQQQEPLYWTIPRLTPAPSQSVVPPLVPLQQAGQLTALTAGPVPPLPRYSTQPSPSNESLPGVANTTPLNSLVINNSAGNVSNSSTGYDGKSSQSQSSYFVTPKDVSSRAVKKSQNRSYASEPEALPPEKGSQFDNGSIDKSSSAGDSSNVVANGTQSEKNWNEYQLRALFLEQNSLNKRFNNNDLDQQLVNSYIQQRDAGQNWTLDVRMSRMTPLWVGGELILARRVHWQNRELIQGCWLNWPTLRTKLLEVVEDILPQAQLVAVNAKDPETQQHLLAALPVELLPGDLGAPAKSAANFSSLQWALILAWSSLALAVGAVALIGQGIITLSERRAAFVSAVTHELRTPLTTFRMYAEMLAEDMVHDERQRRSYCDTLRGEADRLSHLVENVLAYARLERGGPGKRRILITVAELAKIATERLDTRLRQAEMELVEEISPPSTAQKILADPGAVEQILFNLIDNAAKYAATAVDRRVVFSAAVESNWLRLKVRDFGPGISPAARAKLFEPFNKSAADAAGSAPGVGLGLALSRRLAREMGGDLRICPGSDGTCFELLLPLGSSEQSPPPTA